MNFIAYAYIVLLYSKAMFLQKQSMYPYNIVESDDMEPVTKYKKHNYSYDKRNI